MYFIVVLLSDVQFLTKAHMLKLCVWVCVFSAAGKRAFREFLRSEYSEENMLFWLACEDLKRTPLPEVEVKARTIYENYISILSPKEVNIAFIFYQLHSG